MKLYRTPAGLWVGTQADYREAARAEGVSTAVPEPIDVPINPKGDLIAFLNALGTPVAPGEPVQSPEPTTELRTPSVEAQVYKLPLRVQVEICIGVLDKLEAFIGKLKEVRPDLDTDSTVKRLHEACGAADGAEQFIESALATLTGKA